DPPCYDRVEPVCQIVEFQMCTRLQLPLVSNSLSKRARSLWANRGAKTYEELTAIISRRSGPKGVPQKIKAMTVFIIRTARVLAVYHSCLVRMQAELAELQSPFKPLLEPFQLLARPTVHNDIVCVPLKVDSRIVFLHPLVEGKVQEDVGKKWADDATLGCPCTALLMRPIR